MASCRQQNGPVPAPQLDPEQRATREVQVLEQAGWDIVKVIPRRHPDGTFGRLDLAIRQEGRPSLKLSIDGSGVLREQADAKQRMRREHYERWGKVSRHAVAGFLARQRPLPIVAVVDRSAADVSSLTTSALRSGSSGDRLYGTLSFQEAVRLSKRKGVTVVHVAPESAVFEAAYADNGPADWSGSRSSFNAQGYYGENAVVAVQEPLADGCAIPDGHDAFSNANVYYTRAPKSCTMASDCDCTPGWISGVSFTSVCDNGVCRITAPSAHTSAVASRIAATAKSSGVLTPFHAAMATIIIDNDVPNTAGKDLIEHLDRLYEGFASGLPLYDGAGDYVGDNIVVDIVNTSWATGTSAGLKLANGETPREGTGYDAWAHLVDLSVYSRRLNFVKSAGNFGALGGPGNEDANQSVTCNALNALCVGAVSASGTYGDSYAAYADDNWLSDSRWKNPIRTWTYNMQELQWIADRRDAERPDLVAEGGGALVATTTTTDEWQSSNGGTSMAAPVVAGLLALAIDRCRAHNEVVPGPEMFRALFRNHAYVPQSMDPTAAFYPNTPSVLDADAKVGVGIVKADSIRHHLCNPAPEEDPNPTTDLAVQGSGNAADDTLESLPWAAPNGVEPDPDGGYQAQYVDGSLVGHQGSPLKAADSWEMRRLYSFGELREGSRIRASMSFSACPDMTWTPDYQAPSDGDPAVDFDLVLFDERTGLPEAVLLVASETLDDTNEGFDYVLSRDAEDLWLAYVRPSREAVDECKLGGLAFEPYGVSLWWQAQ